MSKLGGFKIAYLVASVLFVLSCLHEGQYERAGMTGLVAFWMLMCWLATAAHDRAVRERDTARQEAAELRAIINRWGGK
jgi:hypothetical protein